MTSMPFRDAHEAPQGPPAAQEGSRNGMAHPALQDSAAARVTLRYEWLDGVRAVAAVFVVLHHSWLMTVGGYPGNNGPWYTDWLIYGHLAVSVFIVVSGYSLTISPAKHGMKLQYGGAGFLRRRFWRIVPPYWAALAFVTLLIGFGATEPANGPSFGPRDFIVHFLLFQDTVGNVSPNGAFWSIAVEWHIYFLFPLVVIGLKRYGVAVVLGAVALLVMAQHLLGAVVPSIGLLDRFTPAYLVLFVAGSAAASLVNSGRGSRTAAATAVAIGLAILVWMMVGGSERTVSAYFWIDLLVGSATAALFVAIGQGRFRWVARVLSTKPLVFVGGFAFSLYLIHAPVLAILTTKVIHPLGWGTSESLLLLLGIGVPAALAVSYGFYVVFERPFLTIRSFRSLAAALLVPVRRESKTVKGGDAVVETMHVKALRSEETT